MTEDKLRRQSALRRLLKERALSNQAQVVEAMRLLGFEVTQPSISRDFTELGVVKHEGRYLVIGPQRQILDLLPAGPNLLVVKTPEGAAPAVGAAIDRLESNLIVGTVAGDDTVFIAIGDARNQEQVVELLRGL